MEVRSPDHHVSNEGDVTRQCDSLTRRSRRDVRRRRSRPRFVAGIELSQRSRSGACDHEPLPTRESSVDAHESPRRVGPVRPAPRRTPLRVARDELLDDPKVTRAGGEERHAERPESRSASGVGPIDDGDRSVVHLDCVQGHHVGMYEAVRKVVTRVDVDATACTNAANGASVRAATVGAVFVQQRLHGMNLVARRARRDEVVPAASRRDVQCLAGVQCPEQSAELRERSTSWAWRAHRGCTVVTRTAWPSCVDTGSRAAFRSAGKPPPFQPFEHGRRRDGRRRRKSCGNTRATQLGPS